MQCEEWADANSELFKEAHDETVHKNSYKRKLYELISASLKLIAAKGGDTTALGSERPVKPENPPAGSRFILRTFSATTLLHNLRRQPRPFLLRHSRPPTTLSVQRTLSNLRTLRTLRAQNPLNRAAKGPFISS